MVHTLGFESPWELALLSSKVPPLANTVDDGAKTGHEQGDAEAAGEEPPLSLPPELREIAAAWESLPPGLRQAVLSIIRSGRGAE